MQTIISRISRGLVSGAASLLGPTAWAERECISEKYQYRGIL